MYAVNSEISVLVLDMAKGVPKHMRIVGYVFKSLKLNDLLILVRVPGGEEGREWINMACKNEPVD